MLNPENVGTQRVDELTSSDRDREWVDRFGWRIWWLGGDVNGWVTQAASGAGSDKPRTVDDLDTRGPFTSSPRDRGD